MDDVRRRRRDGKSGDSHGTPAGGLFDRYVCPHYLGELIEWCGFAAMTQLASSFAFAFWTFANLFPRATAYREWYRERFGTGVVRRAMVAW